MSDSSFGVYRIAVFKVSNIAFAMLFILLFLVHLLRSVKYKQCWVGLFIGTLLEAINYCFRASAQRDAEKYLLVGLSLAFIMAGYYYLLAPTTTIYGPVATVLKPYWCSDWWICSSMGLLVMLIQDLRYLLSPATQHDLDAVDMDRIVIIFGLECQLVIMTILLFFWVLVFYKVYYSTDRTMPSLVRMAKRSFLDTQYKDHIFDPEYARVRATTKFLYFPFVVFVSTLVTYARCFFRMMQLAQGWNGYLMLHENYFILLENYLILLDGLMMALACPLMVLTCLLTVIYYPGWVSGKVNKIKVLNPFWSQKLQQMEQAAHDDQKVAYNEKEADLTIRISFCFIYLLIAVSLSCLFFIWYLVVKFT